MWNWLNKLIYGECILTKPYDPMPTIRLRNSFDNADFTEIERKKLLDDYQVHIQGTYSKIARGQKKWNKK